MLYVWWWVKDGFYAAVTESLPIIISGGGGPAGDYVDSVATGVAGVGWYGAAVISIIIIA